jgi:hypothetical protein
MDGPEGRDGRWPVTPTVEPDGEGPDPYRDPPIDDASTYLRVDERRGEGRRGPLAATFLQITPDGGIAREVPVDAAGVPLGLVWPWEYGVYNDSPIPTLVPGTAEFAAFWGHDIPAERVPVAEFATLHHLAAEMYPPKSRPYTGPSPEWLALPGWLRTILAAAFVLGFFVVVGGFLLTGWLVGVAIVSVFVFLWLVVSAPVAIARGAMRLARRVRRGADRRSRQ